MKQLFLKKRKIRLTFQAACKPDINHHSKISIVKSVLLCKSDSHSISIDIILLIFKEIVGEK